MYGRKWLLYCYGDRAGGTQLPRALIGCGDIEDIRPGSSRIGQDRVEADSATDAHTYGSKEK